MGSFLGLGTTYAAQERTMDAASMFGKDATNDGPITICSDSLSYSQTAHKMIYQGNVLVMQTKDATIQCSAYSVPGDKQNVPSYQFPVQVNDYLQSQKQALEMAKQICQKQKGCRFLTGQTLTISFDQQNNQLTDILLTTNTPYTAKFYSLPFPKGGEKTQPQSDQQTMYAEGRKMNFNLQTSILTIEKEAYVDRAGNRFSGDKVLYDTKSGLVTVPDTGQRATVILNNLNTKN